MEPYAPASDGVLRPQEMSVATKVVFDAVLYPNRSLDRNGFIIVMSIVIMANLLSGIFYLVAGAWPVLIFAAIDALAVWIAFKISYRQGRLTEHILMTADDLWVTRVTPSGVKTIWHMQPFWTTAGIANPLRHDSQLKLHNRGEYLTVGAFLSPKERGELADAIQTALNAIREVPADSPLQDMAP